MFISYTGTSRKGILSSFMIQGRRRFRGCIERWLKSGRLTPVKIRQVTYRKIAKKTIQTPITGVYLSLKKVYSEKIGAWPLVSLYRLPTFIALPV